MHILTDFVYYKRNVRTSKSKVLQVADYASVFSGLVKRSAKKCRECVEVNIGEEVSFAEAMLALDKRPKI